MRRLADAMDRWTGQCKIYQTPHSTRVRKIRDSATSSSCCRYQAVHDTRDYGKVGHDSLPVLLRLSRTDHIRDIDAACL